MTPPRESSGLIESTVCHECGRTVRLTYGAPTYYGRIRRWVGHAKDCPRRTMPGAPPR